MDFELRHQLRGTPEAVFAELQSPAFRQEMDARQRLEKTLVESREEGEGIRTDLYHVVERLKDAPAFVQKLLGASMTYTLEQRISQPDRTIKWRVTPGAASDRVRAHGTELIEAGPDGHASRVLRGVVEVDAPFVGKNLAQFIGGRVKAGFEQAMPFIEEWCEQRVLRGE